MALMNNDRDRDSSVKGYTINNTSENQSDNVQLDAVEEKMFQDIAKKYLIAMERSGMNVADPIMANTFYYNKSNFNISDPPQVGKTYVFITRPDCNFAAGNITAVPWFSHIFETAMGKHIMAMLSHPHRKINHEYAQDDYGKQASLMEKIFARKAQLEANSSKEGDISKVNDDAAQNDPEIQNLMKELSSNWDEQNPREKADDNVQLNEWGHSETFDFRRNKEPQEKNGHQTYSANRIFLRDARGRTKSDSQKSIIFNTPFIPLLQNHCIEVSASKDFTIGQKTTEGDFFGGTLSFPTGAGDMNAHGEITLTFRDNYFSYVYYTIWTWMKYIHHVSVGDIMPRISNIWERTFDWDCSIYVFVTDKDQSTLKGWAKYTGCRPTNISTAGIAHSIKNDLGSNWETFSIPFVYNHVEFNEPSIITDFNYVAGTEYFRRVKKDFVGFSLHNSRRKSFKDSEIFEYATNKENISNTSKYPMGASGRFPDRALRVDASGNIYVGTDSGISSTEINTKEIEYINRLGLDSQLLTYHNHWNGYPMIVSNRLIWVHQDEHRVKQGSSGYTTKDDDTKSESVTSPDSALLDDVIPPHQTTTP